MPTYKKLFEKDIRKLLMNTTKKGRNINSKVLRNRMNTAATGMLNLNIEQLKFWDEYYKREEERILTEGTERELTNLNKKDDIAQRAIPGAKRDLKAIRNIVLTGLNKDPSKYHLGHKDVGPGMVKLKLWLDFAVPKNKKEAEIINEQKRIVNKMLRVEQFIERIHNDEVRDIMRDADLNAADGIDDDVLIELVSRVTEKVSINSDFIMQTTPGGPELTFDVEFEQDAENLASGALTSLMGKKFSKVINAKNKEALDTFKKTEFGEALMRVPGSLTFLQRTGRFISNLILGKGKGGNLPTPKDSRHTLSKEEVIKPSAGVAAKVSVYNNLKKSLAKRIRSIRYRKDSAPKVPTIGIFNVMGMINFILNNEVAAQMGRSSDPPTKLRWQTGRFADSAKLIALKESTGRPILPGSRSSPLIGVYTYMHNPYDVFRRGRPLDNGLRDPKIYVEDGIRAAARTILQSRYPGMVLEVDK